MPLAKLNLSPGMARFGTVYESRGRWYTGNLVRWVDRVLQPWGGWVGMTRTNGGVSAAISDDGGVMTDETDDANDSGADDVVLSTASRQVNDAFYVGKTERFTQVQIKVGTATTDGAVTWEYWDGAAWQSLSGVADGTTSFTVAGTNSVTFTLPSDWATTTVNSQGPFYYVRARVTTLGTGVAATGTQVWIGPGDAPDDNGSSPLDLDEPVRGAHAWKRNTGTPLIALGTPTKLYLFGTGGLTDITPEGLTTGGADASQTSGAFGTGVFGAGAFGVGDEAVDALTEANTWQLDNHHEDLIAYAHSDGKIYRYDSSAGGIASAVSNAPTNCAGVVVTPENILMALGPSAVPRNISWADVDDITDWTSTEVNLAGDLTLRSPGRILAGRATSRETLVWTDVDVWAVRYVGGEFVYGALRLGSSSLISRRGMAVYGDQAIWMGKNAFFLYDGEVRTLPSDVADYVFNDINLTQASKIHAYTNMDFGETVWHYPSSTAVECDRYVVYNHPGNFFYTGDLDRTAGVDTGVYSYPILADSTGVVYRHEVEGIQPYGALESAIVDAYSESNYSSGLGEMYSGGATRWSQTFTIVGPAVVNWVEFYLRKEGSVSGNVTGAIWSTTGGEPSAELVSATVAASSIGTSPGLTRFTLADPYVLPAGTYAAVVEYSSAGDADNNVAVAYDSSSPTHDGALGYYSGGDWSEENGSDLIFRVSGQRSPALTPHIESGPVEIGDGDQVMDLLGIVPDEKSGGDVRVYVYTSYYPTGAETENGPYTLSELTSIRLNGRWIRLKFEEVNPGWRVGTTRVDVQPGGRR